MSGVKGWKPLRFDGAIDGVRTRDLRLGKPPLCQLSYYRMRVSAFDVGRQTPYINSPFYFLLYKRQKFF